MTANGFVGASKKNCEFCAAREVKGTFATAWKEVTPYLSKPPVKTKAEPKKNGPAKLSILTIPPGATLKLDGKTLPKKSPYELEVKAGEHTVEASLEGYVNAKRKFKMQGNPLSLIHI